MAQTPDQPELPGTGAEGAPRKRAGGLNGMLLADLKALAQGLGVAGAGSMKKAQLVDAIKAAQGGAQAPRAAGSAAPAASATTGAPSSGSAAAQEEATGGQPDAPRVTVRTRTRKQAAPAADAAARADEGAPARTPEQDGRQDGKRDGKQDGKRDGKQDGKQDGKRDGKQGGAPQDGPTGKQDKQQDKQPDRQDGKQQDGRHEPKQAEKQGRHDDEDDEQGGSRRNRRRRGRDREARTGGQGAQGGQGGQGQPQGGGRREPDTQVLEDDVLVPAAGILDVLDNYAFVRTSGYLAGTDDVYVSLSLVRRLGLRPGDAVVGQVRQPREGERREKFNPMVRIDAVNGGDPESARERPDFARLTPVHPTERIRLETSPDNLPGRVLDLVAPVGKGQRGLIVSPAKAGKTTMLQAVAAAVTANNPECHLMVVLLDERPEEVTDFARSVKGEVIASTFDRPPADHTSVAELAIERAKRLVELGTDVVVLLDGLTRLGRAYDLAAHASGRTATAGVDPSALHPAKKFFGAARNVEDGGSLTILATAAAETGSASDEVILEAFVGTENSELRLVRELAARRLLPAVDVHASGTRRVDLLLGAEEAAAVERLRASLAGQDRVAALEDLLGRLGRTRTNLELLSEVARTPAPKVSRTRA